MSRIRYLTSQNIGKVIVALRKIDSNTANTLEQEPIKDFLFLNCDACLAYLGQGAFDMRLAEHAGTSLSNQACLAMARELGCRQIPAALCPPIKAIIVDLDNTIYSGVLAEDGAENITPYMNLQTVLKNYTKQGFMLAAVSKNQLEDVKGMFAKRKDFTLQWQDFTSFAINWHDKWENIMHIANTLNIGLDSMLYLDDNPGERLQTAHAIPELKIVQANTPEEMLAALEFYPGLYKTFTTMEDYLRKEDIQANTMRVNMKNRLSPEDYMRELGISLQIEVNPQEHLVRLTELFNKTNQFVLSYLRPVQKQVTEFLSTPKRCVISISMRDKLSNSGLVAAGLFGKEGEHLHLYELTISCRALGRGVEGLMITLMAEQAKDYLNTENAVFVHYKKGERNLPAMNWLQNSSETSL